MDKAGKESLKISTGREMKNPIHMRDHELEGPWPWEERRSVLDNSTAFP